MTPYVVIAYITAFFILSGFVVLAQADVKIICSTPPQIAELTLEIPNNVLPVGGSTEVYCVNWDSETGTRVVGEAITLHFLPEPSTLLQVVAGCGLIAILKRRAT